MQDEKAIFSDSCYKKNLKDRDCREISGPKGFLMVKLLWFYLLKFYN